MNGRTHALIGCAIVPPTALTSGLSLPETAVLTAISAGFSLGPDIDHPNSTISKAVGRPVHELLHGLATAARNVVATPLDKARFARAEERGIDPSHRGLTHTLVFTVGMGGVGYLVGHSSMATAALAALCLVVCHKLLPGRWRMGVLGGALALFAFGAYLELTAQQVAMAATAGWLSHVLADSCTTAGVPLLWPLVRIKGRKWFRVRTLGGWIYTGDLDAEMKKVMRIRQRAASAGVVLAMNAVFLIPA